MPKENNTSVLSIRLDSTLKATLASIAKEEHRSLNNLIALILDKYVSEYDILKEDSKPGK